MNIDFITVEQFVGDWLDETGHKGHFNIDEIEKFAQDEAEELCKGDSGKEFVTLLYVEDYTAKLPVNYQRDVQVAYNIFPTKPVRREEISEFTLPVFGGTGCKLKINLECPKCHKEVCSCSTPVVEVNADHLYKISHPEHHTAYWNHFHSYTNLTEYPRDQRCNYHPQFRLMYPQINDFWNIQYNVSECQHLSLDNEISYLIDRPNIVVNFQQGQILLNYFGLRLDDSGKSLIPNDRDAIDAIVKYVEMKISRSDWRNSKKREDRDYYLVTKQEYEVAHGKAVRKLQRLTPNKMSRLFRNIMRKRDFIPNRPNLNRATHERRMLPNQSSGRIR